MIYSLVVLASVIAVSNAKLFVSDEAQQKYMWEGFKREYGKSYETMEEEMSRFSHFLTNLKIADHRNMQEHVNGGTAVHGITRFSDMSQEEFQLRFLLADSSKKSNDTPVASITGSPKLGVGLVDWTGVLTTPVKNQGYCGSCWAFSATEQIESDYIRSTGKTYVLSPEQITQCTTGAFGCGGGWTETAYVYAQRSGIVQDADYPYTSYQGTTGQCNVDLNKAVVHIKGYTTLSGESEMATYMQTEGPLSVCIDANTWNSYQGGIMSVCGKQVDHCVQAVGVNVDGGYWKVRNSWGTSWGESGFIRLAYGQDTCAITHDPSYVTIK